MKKPLVFLLILTLLLGLFAACGRETPEASVSEAADSETGTLESEVEAPAEIQEPAEVQDSSASQEEALPEDDGSGQEESEPEPEPAYFPLDETGTLTMFFTYPPIEGTINGPEDYVVFKEAEERLNVHIDFNAVSIPASGDQFALLVASGDYPDILPEVARYYTGGMSKALEDEVIVDLSPYLEDYAPNYQAARIRNEMNARNTMADDGSVYGFYLLWTLEDAVPDSGLGIRQDWLDRLGLDVPRTIDELHDTLTAMQTLGCENPYDITYSGGCDDAILEAYDCTWSYGSPGLVAIDGEIQASGVSEGTYEYVKMMNQWYQEGLIDPDFYSQFNYALSLRDSIVSEKRGVFFIQNINIDAYQAAIGGDAVIVPMSSVGFEPDQTFHVRPASGTENNSFAITTDCSDLELAMRYLDWFYTDEGEILCNYGVEGQAFEYDENGNPQYTELITNNESGQNTAITLYTGYKAVPNMLISSRLNGCNSESYVAAGEKWSDRQDAAYAISTQVSLTAEETEAVSLILSEIETYTQEHLIKMITGDEYVETQWESYCQGIRDLGLQTVIDTYQAAYDRYMQRGA